MICLFPMFQVPKSKTIDLKNPQNTTLLKARGSMLSALPGLKYPPPTHGDSNRISGETRRHYRRFWRFHRHTRAAAGIVSDEKRGSQTPLDLPYLRSEGGCEATPRDPGECCSYPILVDQYERRQSRKRLSQEHVPHPMVPTRLIFNLRSSMTGRTLVQYLDSHPKTSRTRLVSSSSITHAVHWPEIVFQAARGSSRALISPLFRHCAWGTRKG